MVEEMNSEMTNVMSLKEGDIVKGTIAKIEEKEALVNIGYKYDGILPIGEIANVHIEKITDVLKVGDQVECKVLRVNDGKEQVLLSKKVIDREKAWDTLQHKLSTGEVFEVKVADVVKGGLVVDVGVRGFVPASMVERHFVEDFADYKGKTLRVKVVEIDQDKNKVILSQRAVLDEEFNKKQKELVAQIKVGDILLGTVQRLTNFGAFIDLGRVDGLVHVSEISWNRIGKPVDVLKEGDKVNVKVLRVDPETKRISLSIKETMQNPIHLAIENLKIGEIYTGIVKRLVSFGAFVEIQPNVEGLVHISQISHQHIGQPSEVLKIGQEVKVKVLDVDPSSERISLSIREAEEQEVEKEVKENHLIQEQHNTGFTLADILGDKLKKLK
ncbi:30S ribosomal protein S1 [Tepidibacillus decaturensis]|uniref:30S ribosomal protein S1 n=1 Tax=Tepidibacillus decaturensis TaxID=1413211 RepID=A0A135L411_9BACI|nr:30S ribosomal protein S1 [Tepidibacillus decaturensis]KXG43651.1 30S ribosomal protein S1 [Tepidibacillus decaturensis]